MKRRTVLAWLALGPVVTHVTQLHAQPKTAKGIKEMQDNWKSLLAPGTEVPNAAEPLTLTKEEWRKRLPPQAYGVLRQEDTERPNTSPLDREKRPGVFACAGCGLPLFTSEMKFDSGTGWPSFVTYIPGTLQTKTDYKIVFPRTEYHCARCGGHQGHLFDDGPPPTGKRYCNNGVALKFIPQKA